MEKLKTFEKSAMVSVFGSNALLFSAKEDSTEVKIFNRKSNNSPFEELLSFSIPKINDSELREIKGKLTDYLKSNQEGMKEYIERISLPKSEEGNNQKIESITNEIKEKINS